MFGMRKNGWFSSQQENPTEQIKIIGYIIKIMIRKQVVFHDVEDERWACDLYAHCTMHIL